MQKTIILLLLFIVTGFNARADSIEGNILLRKAEQGSLHILLVDEKTFSKPLNSIRELIIPIDLNDKPVAFSFENIPSGTYGIRCFLDTDFNKKLNRGLTGPTEPWGMSWQTDNHPGWPKFEYISFYLNGKMQIPEIAVE